jgi:hypothetical protein
MPAGYTRTKKGCPCEAAFFGKGKKDEKTNWRLVENDNATHVPDTFYF